MVAFPLYRIAAAGSLPRGRSPRRACWRPRDGWRARNRRPSPARRGRPGGGPRAVRRPHVPAAGRRHRPPARRRQHRGARLHRGRARHPRSGAGAARDRNRARRPASVAPRCRRRELWSELDPGVRACQGPGGVAVVGDRRTRRDGGRHRGAAFAARARAGRGGDLGRVDRRRVPAAQPPARAGAGPHADLAPRSARWPSRTRTSRKRTSRSRSPPTTPASRTSAPPRALRPRSTARSS